MVASVSWGFCLCIHVSIFAWYAFAPSFIDNFVAASESDAGEMNSYGGKWKNATRVNLAFQTVFFALCVLTDIVHLMLPAKCHRGGRVQSLLVKLRDDFFTMVAFPCAAFVFSFFWLIYAVDQELVYPKVIEAIIPTWMNHAMHTIIMPLVLVQMYIQNHVYPSRLKCVTVLLFIDAIYFSWVLWVHHVSGIWVYPFFAKMSLVGIFLFFGVTAGWLYLLFLLGEKVSGRIWGNPGPQKKRY